MTLEFICSITFEPEKKIILPSSANVYEIDFQTYKISFYHDNPGKKNYIELGTWAVPLNAREMDFEFRPIRSGGYITGSRFYDANGNLLKIGNR